MSKYNIISLKNINSNQEQARRLRSAKSPTEDTMTNQTKDSTKTPSPEKSAEDVLVDSPIHLLINNLKDNVSNLLTDAMTTGSKNQKRLMKAFETTVTTIHQVYLQEHTETIRLATENTMLKDQLKEQRIHIDELTSKITTSTDIVTALDDRISAMIKQQLIDMAVSLPNGEETNDKSLDPPTQGVASQATETDVNLDNHRREAASRKKIAVDNNRHNIVPQERQTSTRTDPARRTLVIKSRAESTGAEIMNKINQISPTVGLIDLVIPKRYTVHVVCNTPAKRETLKRELQGDRRFNLALNAVNLPLDTYKILIQNVPKDLTKEYVTESIIDCFNLQNDDFNIISSYQHRNGGTNWIAVSPLDIARKMVDFGGLTIGLRYVKINPHTSIQRCKTCHQVGHQAKRCTATPLCPVCSEEHDLTEKCQKQPNCINCKIANKEYRERNPTDHQPTSFSCPTYNFFYTEEREKINEIFSTNRNRRMTRQDQDLLDTYQDYPDHVPRRQQYQARPASPDLYPEYRREEVWRNHGPRRKYTY